MKLENVLGLIGGLALFLFGMNLMGESLKKQASGRLKNVWTTLTTSTFKGFLLGLVVTIVIQSSSATTVMVVGFVNSGFMTLQQSVGVIMGANLGASITSWILATSQFENAESALWILNFLKPSFFMPILAFVGVLFYMFIGKGRKKDLGSILLGVSVLLYGMEAMSTAVHPLAEMEGFRNLMVKFSNPLLGLFVGTAVTALIQSSGASVGILQALSTTGAISYGTSIPIVMGQNIGTCVTAMISSVGATKNAKRAAWIHLYFNVISAVVLLSAYAIVSNMVPIPILEKAAGPVGIAVVHTVFKLIALVLWMPFTKQLVKLAVKTVPDAKSEEKIEVLDERLLDTPSVALDRCREATNNMAVLACDTLAISLDLLSNYTEKVGNTIREGEEEVDHYEDMLGTYLVKLSGRNMTENDSREVTKLLHMIGDFERISDHAVNILETAQEIADKNLSFSAEATQELDTMTRAVLEILNMTLTAFTTDDLALALHVEPLEQTVDYLKSAIKKRHVQRLQRNECTIEMGFILADILTNLERVSDHCSNVALCMLEIAQDSLEMHEYQQKIRDNDISNYNRTYDEYMEKYKLPERGEGAKVMPAEAAKPAPTEA